MLPNSKPHRMSDQTEVAFGDRKEIGDLKK